MTTALDIIELLRKFTLLNRRMNNKGSCEYMTKDGKKCIVGMCMQDVEYDKFEEVASELQYTYTWMEKHNLNPEYKETEDGMELVYVELDSVLRLEYRGFPIDFWTDLQVFHDNSRNFTNVGFTELGEIHYQQLVKKYGNLERNS